MNKITFLTCGGTIDKDYGMGKGIYDVKVGPPIINKIINKFDINLNVEILEVVKKDSLNMNVEDRKLLQRYLDEVEGEKVIITHGTDTMIETGQALGNIGEKVVILVGSSRPWSMKNSDAELNIGYAMGIADILGNEKKYGVYIAMNGECFDVQNVEKLDNGIFRKLKITQN